jgi:tetrahydromethanopterin S-methyltransferase subunit B
MTYVKLLPEFNLSYNIDNGKVEPEAGAAGGVVKYNFKPINDSITMLDSYADDLMNSLAPTGGFRDSWPGRTKSIYYASIWTNIFYGFIVGGIAACVFVLIWFAKAKGLM